MTLEVLEPRPPHDGPGRRPARLDPPGRAGRRRVRPVEPRGREPAGRQRRGRRGARDDARRPDARGARGDDRRPRGRRPRGVVRETGRRLAAGPSLRARGRLDVAFPGGDAGAGGRAPTSRCRAGSTSRPSSGRGRRCSARGFGGIDGRPLRAGDLVGRGEPVDAGPLARGARLAVARRRPVRRRARANRSGSSPGRRPGVER